MSGNYWDLFWKTGLPEAWLLSRLEDKPGAVAAFAELDPWEQTAF